MLKRIVKELERHAPFTTFGALTGIVVMLLFYRLPEGLSFQVFYVLHPLHVVLSALVTASMYEHYKCGILKVKCNLLTLLAIGYVGSIGIATLSDSLIPYLGEVLLNLPNREIHIGFIEHWWIVNPAALLGVAIAYYRPRTKFPHAGHVLLSTWASLFHIIMALGGTINWFLSMVIFFFLFLAVWVPCCVSDIVFPLLFVGEHDHEAECCRH
ncbi:MAG: hypothetical protein U9R38_01230 [Candidatus Margulisiibacteriota bacterium]|nr:hypothetical protein [Candidatus Margulisiibacteriota bacterium]